MPLFQWALRYILLSVAVKLVFKVVGALGFYYLTFQGIQEAWQYLLPYVTNLESLYIGPYQTEFNIVLNLLSVAGIDDGMQMLLAAYTADFGLSALIIGRGYFLSGKPILPTGA